MGRFEHIALQVALVKQLGQARIFGVAGQQKAHRAVRDAHDERKIVFFVLAIIACIGHVDGEIAAVQRKFDVFRKSLGLQARLVQRLPILAELFGIFFVIRLKYARNFDAFNDLVRRRPRDPCQNA